MTAYFEQIKIFLLPPCGLVQQANAADFNRRFVQAIFGAILGSVVLRQFL